MKPAKPLVTNKSSVNYKLVYTRTAAKDIGRLDTVVAKKIKNKLEFYQKNPLFYAKKLINSRLGTFRWRIGNHRVIFDLHQNQIVILRLGHRSQIYR